MTASRWPGLVADDWSEVRATFHMWTQIVGKIRMACAPMLNHWWHVTLYVSPRGLTTGPVPHDGGLFDIEFDLVADRLVLRHSDGGERVVPLRPMTVAVFYAEVMDALGELGIEVSIHASPNEVDPAIPFALDTTHAAYDGESVRAFWRQLVQADRLLGEFRAGFIGKASPVHFFWGAMDLAVTRFSGRPAPEHPGGVPNCPPHVMVEGYSHEITSAGFWPGGGAEGAFYSYAYPVPPGYAEATVPAGAFYSEEYGEFLLPYEVVREADDPDRLVLDFLGATHDAAASLAGWDDLTRR
jgi:hypothetical protein